ncbi:MAG: hypothetical protein JW912_06190 [Sedimentisphaerales bacterium]|nr:hypothetical protein [Sedimentisphaerales bacterium]
MLNKKNNSPESPLSVLPVWFIASDNWGMPQSMAIALKRHRRYDCFDEGTQIN